MSIFRRAKELMAKFPFEAGIWISGLIYLSTITPTDDAHFSICLLNILGLDFCPGCGLGKSVSYLFHGDVLSSFNSHPLGLFAIVVIGFRIYTLLKNQIILIKQK